MRGFVAAALLVLSLLLNLHTAAASAWEDKDFFKSCPPSRCSEHGPEIRFPFQLESNNNTTPSSCGSPCMKLSCSGQDTILHNKYLGRPYKLTAIDYKHALLTAVPLADEDNYSSPSPCPLLKSISIRPNLMTGYGYYNLGRYQNPCQTYDTYYAALVSCSTEFALASVPGPATDNDYIAGPISCLSNQTHFSYLVAYHVTMSLLPLDCEVISDGAIPIPVFYYSGYIPSISTPSADRILDYPSSYVSSTFRESAERILNSSETMIRWYFYEYDCRHCEQQGRRCAFSSQRNQTFCMGQGSRVKVIAATSSVAAFVVLLLMVATALYLFLKTRYNEEIHLKVEMFLKTYGTSKPTRYTFSEVKKISRRFKVKVGQGGFGSVYRGELPNGVPVAVKMLENSLGEGDEFINEVATIGRIHHANIKAHLVSSLLVVIAADVVGAGQNQQCLSSCGHLGNISYPFRLQGDSRQCVATPRPWYNLSCSSGNATIRINTGTYIVTSIIIPEDDTNSSCTLPRSDHLPFLYSQNDSYGFDNFAIASYAWACFVNCSRAVVDMRLYKPITCLSANNSFVFVSTPGVCTVRSNQSSCRYLAMIPFDGWHISDSQLQNASYTDIIGFIRKGVSVSFPIGPYQSNHISVTECLKGSKRYFKQHTSRARFNPCSFLERNILRSRLHKSRLLLGSLVIFIFLAHKYWKTRITIDAVEKFLRMQQMIGPTRFAYTDIIAITSHFRDKLGQRGYGSVYKGVLLPGNLHITVKMLTGSSSCNGDEFISEVSTIGRIHHVNVVRLVGFCSEEMRRALVYEYMPRGSLDKYIFSAEKSFSWDKLNEIALGIARGINYLHQGCEMHILHFDIKPHNILLDDNFAPKVADFGLAKLYPRDKSFVPVSAARGTVGYIAPEMISRSFGVISSKSDVYSFGMLLLEMAGGRRNADPNAANSSQAYYPSRVYKELTRRETSEISDIADMN
uniref:non-specific serine/threonine protein kinase n=1 Tax=Oryza meridionalis TaxID=40149 RepID=A0A0E0BW48_9ORYZ